jgi:cell division initiation protein
MPLTPIDVQQKTFGTALRGYDLDEVDDFLDDIVTSLKDYEQRLRDAQERISTLESEMSNRGDAEGAIARALVAAQRSADAIVEEAKTEAARVLSDARIEADEVVVRRERELADAQGEVDRLRSVVDDLRRRVRSLADDLDGSIGEMSEAIDRAEVSLSAAPAGDEAAEPESPDPWAAAPAEPPQPEPEPQPESEPEAAYHSSWTEPSGPGRHSQDWETVDEPDIDDEGALEPLGYGSGEAGSGPGSDAPHEPTFERVTRPWEED